MTANLELIEGWYATLDFDRYLADDVDFEVMEGFPEGGRHRGRSDVAAMFGRFMALYSEFKAEIEDIIDGGSGVTGVGTYRGVLKSNGESFEIPFCHIWYLKNGQIVRMRHFVNTLKMAYALDAKSWPPAG